MKPAHVSIGRLAPDDPFEPTERLEYENQNYHANHNMPLKIPDTIKNDSKKFWDAHEGKLSNPRDMLS